jgi:hypothetical protein
VSRGIFGELRSLGLKLGILVLGLLKKWVIRVCILPRREEVLVSLAG